MNRSSPSVRALRAGWMAMSLALSAAAFGHAKLLHSAPAANAELTAPPTALLLTFNETVRLGSLTLTRDGHDVPLVIDRQAAPSAAVSVALPPLAAGGYTVAWSALTLDDGHIVKGRYTFVVR